MTEMIEAAMPAPRITRFSAVYAAVESQIEELKLAQAILTQQLAAEDCAFSVGNPAQGGVVFRGRAAKGIVGAVLNYLSSQQKRAADELAVITVDAEPPTA